MREKLVKQARREVKRSFTEIVLGVKDIIESLPLRKRIKLALNLVFKGKFEM